MTEGTGVGPAILGRDAEIAVVRGALEADPDKLGVDSRAQVAARVPAA